MTLLGREQAICNTVSSAGYQQQEVPHLRRDLHTVTVVAGDVFDIERNGMRAAERKGDERRMLGD